MYEYGNTFLSAMNYHQCKIYNELLEYHFIGLKRFTKPGIMISDIGGSLL